MARNQGSAEQSTSASSPVRVSAFALTASSPSTVHLARLRLLRPPLVIDRSHYRENASSAHYPLSKPARPSSVETLVFGEACSRRLTAQ